MASKGKKSTQRKLTAIPRADVVDYSRLMGADEEATVATFGAYRKVFTSKIKKQRGRVVDAKGDALLAEFAAVTNAISCAVEIQRELAKRIPAEAFGTPVAQCPDDELVLAACEHAGMLATLRWIMDPRREWGEAGIMDVDDRPF